MFSAIASIFKKPFIWILDRIHYIAFVMFLNNRYNIIGQTLIHFIPKLYNDFDVTEIRVPKLWLRELFRQVNTKSKVFGDLGREKLDRAPKEPRYPASYMMNKFSSDKDQSFDTFQPKSSLYGTLIKINDVLLEFNINRMPSKLNHDILEHYSTEIAHKIDHQIVDRFEHGEYGNKALINSIVLNKYVVNRVSRGIGDLSGYIRTKIGVDHKKASADDLKTTIFHLPMKARKLAKWYMHSNIGLFIATLKDGGGNYLIDQRDDALRTVGVPDRLLGKPIVYNDEMRDEGVIVIFGDLSHAYTVVMPDTAILSFDTLTQYSLIFKMGGDIVHPEFIKVMRTSDKEQPKSLSVDQMYADQELETVPNESKSVEDQ